MAFVYFLQSKKDGKWYIGQTSLSDVRLRLAVHESGQVKSTANRRPFRLAYYEEYENRSEAMTREWHLKHPKGFLEKRGITEWLLRNQSDWPKIGPIVL